MDLEADILNTERVLEATGGDPEFMAELMTLFLEDAQERLTELQSALDSLDAEAVGRCAHKLKGSSSNVGAQRVEMLARSLERAAHSGELNRLDDAVGVLESELAKIPGCLETLAAR